MTFAVPQQGLGIFSDDLLALANGSLIDVLPMATFNGTSWTYSEKLVSFDALDPLRTTTAALPPVGAINAEFLVTGSTIREFFSSGGTLVMRSDAVNGATSAPVVIDPAHPGKAFYEGSFNLGDGSFAVVYGVNDGTVSGSFLQRFAADGTAIGAAKAFTAGLSLSGQIGIVDSAHFVMNWHTAANPGHIFSQVFDLDGNATSTATEIKRYAVAEVLPVPLSFGEGGSP
jgi:hypothetical protein